METPSMRDEAIGERPGPDAAEGDEDSSTDVV
jgi:hypothetical protein